VAAVLIHVRSRIALSTLPADHIPPRRLPPADQLSLVDLVDRLLGEGVVVAGRVSLSIADVDLVDVSLHLLLTSVYPGLSPLDVGGDAE
jgi:hypothetical protein